MTVHELSQLYWLQKEIANDAERLAELRAAISSPKAQALTGMPKNAGGGKQLEDAVARLTELEATIAAKRIRCIEEQNKLESYISGIDDSLTRQAFTYRFVDGLPWVKVARKIGGGNTAEGVRKRVWRHLRNTG